ncbi:hypothetical protein [Bacillus sp. T33-2]|uniref:hypothetical protein n=1 Tax=Bacillus sp. T33-2 TaxID=2054168 RepID=UPI000C783F06|nr:hypothetical protein [Bacillus sp. T33-2]PLR99558.1 hypothetical protein CVD19_00410 [Bacillus sp. T33-2]
MSWKFDAYYCDHCDKEIKEGQEYYSMAARDNWDQVHIECFHDYTINALSAYLGTMKPDDNEDDEI